MNASERIQQLLESQIHAAELLPGDPIEEDRLMAQFGVSRTPVREALLQLKAKGLVTHPPRGGMVVAKLTLAQLYAMWELMAELEGLCARYACERMSSEERAALQQAHASNAAVIEADDAVGWQRANLAFHEILYAGARNPYLRQEIIRMRTRTQAYRRHAFGAYGRLQVSHSSHQAIVDAILAHDPQAAQQAGYQHLNPSASAPAFANLLRDLPRELLGNDAEITDAAA